MLVSRCVHDLLSQLFSGWSGAPFAVQLWDGTRWSSTPPARPQFTVIARDPALLPDLAARDLEGLGDAYVAGGLELEGDLLACFSLFDYLAASSPERAQASPRTAASLAFATRHEPRSLARARDAANFHYELPSEFFALFLDAQRVYSCAYFHRPEDTLETAQVHKLEHVCRKLRIRPGDTLLDLGCGWGALAIHAARHHGALVTGITLGAQQAEVARSRVRDAGLTGRCTIEVCDFRELAGAARFDHIASIGAVEHVTGDLLPAYYARCRELLRPGGLLLSHGISSRPSRPLGAGNAFQRKYIFPDHELVPVSRTLVAAEAAGFEVRDVESLREHYARTLAAWYQRLDARRHEATELVGDATVRAFTAYLAGTSYHFGTGDLDIHQSLLERDGGGVTRLPLTRADLYRAP
nr:cyclopropane-fatty-acyl-phospholipid synthase family protein [Kofleriaceae bacterium]